MAVRPALHLETHARENLRIAGVNRQQFILDDRLRHVPRRIDDDIVHRRGQKRRLRLRLAGDDLGAPDDLVVAHDLERVVGNVEHHIGLAEIARQPAPAFHRSGDGVGLLRGGRTVDGGERAAVDHAGRLDVGARLHVFHRVEQRLVVDQFVRLAGFLLNLDQFDLSGALVAHLHRFLRRRRRGQADIETRAQQRHARILVAGLDRGAACDAVVGVGARSAGAQLGELGLERLVRLMRRIEAVERGVDVAGVRNTFENVGGLGRARAVIDFRDDAVRRDAAGRKMTGEGQNRLRQPDIGGGERVGGGSACEVRRRIIGRVERVGPGILQAGDRRLGVAGETVVANPDRCELARRVIAFQRLALGRIFDALVETLDQLAQTVGDLAVVGGKRFFERAGGRLAGIDRHGGRRRGRRLRQRLRLCRFARRWLRRRLLRGIAALLRRSRVVAARGLAAH